MARTREEIAKMRRAGRVVAEIHATIREALQPGVTTAHLDKLARDVLDRRGATSNFLGYNGYPAVICASPNSVVVHGIPNYEPLEEGDVVSIDCGAIVDGYHGDAAFTKGIGSIDPELQRLIDTTEAALQAGIATLAPGSRLGDLGYAVQTTVEAAGYAIVPGYVGHGIGTAMHEPPDVPNTGRPGRGYKLKDGDTIAIEPMVCNGRPETDVASDGWTVYTRDGSVAAHWEHTVAVTEEGPLVLTI